MRDYILFYLGKSLLDLGRRDEARDVFAELLQNYPESRWVPYTGSQMGAREGKKETLCGEFPKTSEQADCFFRRRQYGQAKGLYGDLTKGSEGGLRRIFYLQRLSQSASRTQDFETALRANEMIRAEFAGKKEAREALRKIASLHQDAGDYRAAIPVLETLLEDRSNSRDERRYYRERLGWSRFRLGSYAGALQSFDEGLAESETPLLLYWKGRSLERLGRAREAGDLFHQLADIYRETYYGIRALERLTKRARYKGWWSSRGKGFHWDKQLVSVEESPDLERIHELHWVGLTEDAGVELRRARARLHLPLPEDPGRIKREGERFVFSSRSLRDEDPDFRIPHAEFLLSEIKRSGKKIDSLLIAAMMRQESRFRDSAVSPAGAVGLLQIMPETGRRVSKEAGWADYEPAWLYDPLTNIELAVRYVKKLSNLFGGKWYLIAASYNAGEKVVSAWRARKGSLSEEEFIEEIPYSETRDYVKKIYTNWRAYRSIYRGE